MPANGMQYYFNIGSTYLKASNITLYKTAGDVDYYILNKIEDDKKFRFVGTNQSTYGIYEIKFSKNENSVLGADLTVIMFYDSDVIASDNENI